MPDVTMFYPHTDVWLCCVPFSQDSEDQILFESAESQYAYFTQTRPHNHITASTPFSYVQKNGILKIQMTYERANQFNYVVMSTIVNTPSGEIASGYIFSYINTIEYVNPNCVNVYLTTDVFQTYQHFMGLSSGYLAGRFGQCLIEREIVDETTTSGFDPNWQEYLLPEPVEAADAICTSVEDLEALSLSGASASDFDLHYFVCLICMGTDAGKVIKAVQPAADLSEVIPEPYIGGAFNGSCYYFGFSSLDFAAKIIRKIGGIEEDPESSEYILPPSQVVSVICLPRPHGGGLVTDPKNDFISLTPSGRFWTDGNPLNYVSLIATKNVTVTTEFSPTSPYNTDAMRYVPHNTKLFTYPYNYTVLRNNSSGQEKVFRSEYFALSQSSNSVDFKCSLQVSPTPQLLVYPIGYEFSEIGQAAAASPQDGVVFEEFPIAPYPTDGYSQYWAQHKGQFIMGTISSAAGIINQGANAFVRTEAMKARGFDEAVGAMKVAGIAGVAISTGLTIGNAAAQLRDMHHIPDTLSGGFSGGAIQCTGVEPIQFRRYTCPDIVMRKLDQFFDMYGYNVNRVGMPALHQRENWDYIQTSGCVIDMAIPQVDRIKLQSMFDNGIRLWHKPSGFLQYGFTSDYTFNVPNPLYNYNQSQGGSQ